MRAVSKQQPKSSASSSRAEKVGKSQITNSSHVITGPWAGEIHKENVEKLKVMSEEEILAQKKNLEAMLDPSTIAFIKSMKNAKNKTKSEILDVCKNKGSSSGNQMEVDENSSSDKKCVNSEMEVDEKHVSDDFKSKDIKSASKMDAGVEDVDKELPEPVIDIVKKAEEKGWVHMDDPEPQKVKWMEDLPENTDDNKPQEEPYNARFDFNGKQLCSLFD